MGEQKADLLRGTLDLLILKTLTLEAMHGLGISRRHRAGHRRDFPGAAGVAFPGTPSTRAGRLDPG